jgi:hypothetical protein
MTSSGMLRHVALVRTDVSEEPSASIIRVTKIGEVGTLFAVTSNRRTLRRNSKQERCNISEDGILDLFPSSDVSFPTPQDGNRSSFRTLFSSI